MNHTSRYKKSNLWQALVASTLVVVISQPAYSFTAINASTDTGTTPSADGYDIQTKDVVLTVNDSDNLTNDTGISVANNNTGAAVSGTGVIFLGSSIVSGTLGGVNPLEFVTLQGAGDNVLFQDDVTLTKGTTMAADGTAIFADGVTHTGFIDNTVGAGKGKIELQGSGTITGSIGDTNAFQLLTANSDGNASELVLLSGPVIKADTILVNDNGIAGQGTTLRFDNAIGQITGNITTKTLNLDTVDFLNAVQVTGDIGTSNIAFAKVMVGKNDDLTVAGNIYAAATQFQADNSLVLTDNHSITGTVTTAVANNGILEFQGTGGVTGQIGTAALPLNGISLQGGAGKTVTLGGAVFLDNDIRFEGAATATSVLNLADNVDVTGDIDNQTLSSAGILNFQGSGSVTGAIGGTKALTAINIQGTNETVTLSSNIFADTLNLTGTGNLLKLGGGVTVPNTRFSAENTITYLALSGPVTGAIDNISGTAGVGTLNFEDDNIVTGTIGATKSLNLININNLGTDVDFNSNVTANTIKFTATPTSAKFADNVIVTGAIDTTLINQGTVNFVGSGQVTGNIGASNNILNLIVNSGGTASELVELNGAVVNSAVINVNDDASGLPAQGTTLKLNNAAMVLTTTNGIRPLTDDEDTLDIYNAATINGNIGNSVGPVAFNLVKVAQNNNTTVNGDIYATTTQFNGNNTLTLTDNSDINGNVTTTVNNQGILALQGTSNITGTIGAPGLALNAINLLGLNEILTIGMDTYVNNINIANDGTVIIADDADFTGNIVNTSGVDDKGTLEFAGSGSVSGNIGASNTLKIINVNTGTDDETVTLSGSVIRATEINVQDNGGTKSTELILNNAAMVLTTTKGITSETASKNTLDIKSAALINSTIGGAGNKFLLVKVGEVGNTIINGSIFATTTEFQGNNKLSLTDGSDVYGDIDSTANQGTLELRGDHTITGTVGATNALSTINVIGAGNTVNFKGDVAANNINFASLANCATTINLSDAVNITGNVDNTTGNTSAGTLNFEGDGSISGTVGVTGAICQVNLNGMPGKNVTFSGDTKVGSGNINFFDDSQFTLANNTQFDASVDNLTGVDSKGTFTITGSSLIKGSVGATNSLKLVEAGENGTVTVFQKTVNTDELTFTANGTVSVENNVSITGPITTQNPGQGNFVTLGNFTVDNQIGGANALNSVSIGGTASNTVTVLSDIFATNTKVNSGGVLLAATPVTIHGNVSLAAAGSTLAVANNAVPLTITGDLNVPAGTNLQFDLNTLIVPTAYIEVNNIATIDMNSNLILKNTPQAYAAGNYDILLVNSGMAGGVAEPQSVIADSLLLTFDVEALGMQQLFLHIDVIPASTYANRINTIGVAGALDAMAGMNFLGSLQELLDQLPYFTTVEQLNDALAALAPIVDNSFTQETFAAQLLGYGAVSDRLRHVRQRKLIPGSNGEFASGIASGDDWDDNGHGRWVKLYGQYSDQNERQQVQGYNAETWGLALGSDVSLNDLSLIGVSANLSHTFLSHDVSDSKTSMYSLQAAIYGEQDFCEWFYFNWVGSVAYNKYTTERNFVFGTLPLSPKGDFNGWQFGGKGELGYEYLYEGYHIIPNASLYYSWLRLGGYNESGAGTASQSVESQSYSMLKGGVGVRAAYNCPYNMGDRRSIIFQPEVRFNIFRDFINDNMQTTSQFTGGGPSFVTTGPSPSATSYNVGASLSVFSDYNNYVVTLSYDLENKSDYQANAGFLRLRYEW
ncbi:MAG: autotransporter domain-containing protein [Candidatus Berkiella sp.]